MLGGRTALGCEPQSRVERYALACHDRRHQFTVLRDDDVLQSSELASLPLDGSAPQRAERVRPGAVEVHLVLLEKDERREYSDLVAVDRRGWEWQEAMHFVAAQQVEADRPSSLRIEEQVDRATELNAVQAHGQAQ
jgi:hypothetical protein